MKLFGNRKGAEHIAARKTEKKTGFPHPDDSFSESIRIGKPVFTDQRCGAE